MQTTHLITDVMNKQLLLLMEEICWWMQNMRMRIKNHEQLIKD